MQHLTAIICGSCLTATIGGPAGGDPAHELSLSSGLGQPLCSSPGMRPPLGDAAQLQCREQRQVLEGATSRQEQAV